MPSDRPRQEIGGGLVGERLGLVVADEAVEPLVRDLVVRRGTPVERVEVLRDPDEPAATPGLATLRLDDRELGHG